MRRHSQAQLDHEERDAVAYAFRQSCIGARVALQVDGPISGTAWRTPEITSIRLATATAPLQLVVRMCEGMLPEQLAKVGRQIAPHLGGAMLRVADRGHGWAVVTLLREDPLLVAVPSAPLVTSALDRVLLGRAEDGEPVRLDLASAAHLIIQGASGSGKSVGCYSLLSQLPAAPDIEVTGSDITGLLLGPWAGHSKISPALGTRRPVDHVEVLEQLVSAMDERIASIPPGRDQVDLAELPILLAVVEETPGLLRLLDATDGDLGKRARLAMARLLGEGRKAGVRLLMITQRADAKIVGAYERGQASHKISFRVDSADGIKMLHPDAGLDVAAEHATAPPGVALLSAPGMPLTRLKAPYLSYADYCATIAASPGAAA